jgi:hypothetical protein
MFIKSKSVAGEGHGTGCGRRIKCILFCMVYLVCKEGWTTPDACYKHLLFQCLFYIHAVRLNTILCALCYLFAVYLKKLSLPETAGCHSEDDSE